MELSNLFKLSTLSYYFYTSGCYLLFLFAVNVTNETGEDSLQIFG